MTTIVDEIGSEDVLPRSVVQVTSKGPSGITPKRVLVIGPRLTTGAVAANTPYTCLNETYGEYGSGVGTPVAGVVYAFKHINKSAIVDAIGIADDGSGVVATGALGLSGTATESGTLAFTIAGRPYSYGVTSGTTAATALTAIKALIDADARRYFLAGTIGSGEIPLTSRWKGDHGNSAKIKQTSAAVAGITVALTQPVGGATNGDITAAIAAMGATKYDRVIFIGNDDTALDLLEAEMARRFTAEVGLQGTVVTGVYGALSAQTTFASSRNSRHVYAIATGLSNTPYWIWAAEWCAKELLAIAVDGGAVFIDQALPTCVAPDLADRFLPSERSTLLRAGMSTYYVSDADGTCYVENTVTNYLTDERGSTDERFRPQRVMNIIDEYRTNLNTLNQRYRSYKLVADGTPTNVGVKALTPGFYKSVIDGNYENYAGTGNVQDVATFKVDSRAEISAINRLTAYHPITISGQVITVASLLVVG